MELLRQLNADIALYGADVVTAFGEYCGHRSRVLQRFDHLGRSVSPYIVSKMVACVMAGAVSSMTPWFQPGASRRI